MSEVSKKSPFTPCTGSYLYENKKSETGCGNDNGSCDSWKHKHGHIRGLIHLQKGLTAGRNV